MRKPEGPCKGCEERTPGCHGTCEKYTKYKERLEEYKTILRATRREDLIPGHRPWMKQTSKAQAGYRNEQKAERRRKERAENRKETRHDYEE